MTGSLLPRPYSFVEVVGHRSAAELNFSWRAPRAGDVFPYWIFCFLAAPGHLKMVVFPGALRAPVMYFPVGFFLSRCPRTPEHDTYPKVQALGTPPRANVGIMPSTPHTPDLASPKGNLVTSQLGRQPQSLLSTWNPPFSHWSRLVQIPLGSR